MLSVGDIVKKTQPSLFWCMRGLQKSKREAVYAIFAFCRHLDSVLRSELSPAEKEAILNDWREELDNIYDKKVPATNIGRKIYKHCIRFDLPKELWLDIVNSALLNARQPLQAPEKEVFEQYMYGTAVVPFKLALMIMENEHPKANVELSKNLGRAVLLTYMLRDIKDDAKSNHFYIPAEILQAASVRRDTPRNMVEDKNLVLARETLSLQAESAYNKAERLLNKMDKTETRPLRLIKNIGKCQFDMMKKRGWEIISPKPQLNLTKRVGIFYKTLFK